jgi:hypothetical protein
MASGRMILFLVFLFIVPAQAPESCSSLSCDDGPIADMRECFLGGAGGLAPSMKRTMDAAPNSILFVSITCLFNNPHYLRTRAASELQRWFNKRLLRMVQYVPIQPHLDKSAYQPGGCSALHPNHLNIWPKV